MSQLIRNKYRILKTLGRDAFSETLLANGRIGLIQHRYIIKRFRPILGNPQANEIKRLFYREASILKRLRGQNRQIPQLYEYFMVGEDFYLVREWIDGLTLEQTVRQQGNLSETAVRQILDSILSVLKYIHSYGIVYRQLKPSSIVLRQNRRSRSPTSDFLPVPIYFGGVEELTLTAEKHDRSLVSTVRREYVPLEQERGKTVYASDIYSLGLTAIYLLTGKTPTEIPIDRQSKQILWHQEVDGVSIHLMRVIDCAICPLPKDRFNSAEAMLQALHSSTVDISMPVPLPSVVKQPSVLEAKLVAVFSLLSLGLLGIISGMLNLNLNLFSLSEANEIYDPVTEARIEAIAQRLDTSDTETEAIPAFTVGVTRQQVIESLGQPTKVSQGYWGDSKALLYRDFVPSRVDLGYLTDTETKLIRQSEMTFAPTVDLLTIQQSAQQLLEANYSATVAEHIEQIYFERSDRQQFQVGNLAGIVQRNPQNHIYLAIWDRQFH